MTDEANGKKAEDNDHKAGRPPQVANVWLTHPQRVTVQTTTFRPGAGVICKNPDDLLALNSWREPPRMELPMNWRERAETFAQHVEFLVPQEADRSYFLDWLAHLEQKPGELPHVGVLMVTPTQGTGRNLLACWLARVWPGCVALDVDLPGLLDGSFNGRLARRTLAVVNEIREGGVGGAISHKRAEALKRLITDEVRLINPKCERQHVEFNCTRWLMFSNHMNALPISEQDRRVFVIENPDRPRDESYYTRLYGLAKDPAFIASVRKALRQRDISGFNPGAIAPRTEARMKVIEAGLTQADIEMRELAKTYPGDCIRSDLLGNLVFDGEATQRERANLRYIAPQVGAVQYPKKVRVYYDTPQSLQYRIWILRNHASWLSAKPKAIADEVVRGEKSPR